MVTDLGDRLDPDLDVILDGGACPIGVESTIVDFCVDPPQILRAGGVPPEQVEALLGSDLADVSGPSRASGMLESHYAPSCPVLLVDTREQANAESLALRWVDEAGLDALEPPVDASTRRLVRRGLALAAALVA